MSQVSEIATGTWTAVDLVARFGAIPLHRVRSSPAPGTATEADVVAIHDHEGRLFELVDATLLEKTVGTLESYLAALILRRIANHVAEHDFGIVLGADGMMRLAPGLVRIPDVSFISWARLPGRRIPDQAIADVSPDLAVEVISPGNTREEMDGKLVEYFAANVREVWYVYPRSREVFVYRSVEAVSIFRDRQQLRSSDILPGFELPLTELFQAAQP